MVDGAHLAAKCEAGVSSWKIKLDTIEQGRNRRGCIKLGQIDLAWRLYPHAGTQ